MGRALLVFVLVVSTLLVAVYFLNRSNNPQDLPVTQPTPGVQGINTENNPSLSLSPEEETLQGNVISVSGPIGYKNSLVLVLSETDKFTNVYLTNTTSISGPDDIRKQREDIHRGQSLLIRGYAMEGGIEATSAKILNYVANPTISSVPSPASLDFGS